MLTHGLRHEPACAADSRPGGGGQWTSSSSPRKELSDGCVDGFERAREQYAGQLDAQTVARLNCPLHFGVGAGSREHPTSSPAANDISVDVVAATLVNRAPMLTAAATTLDVVHTTLSVLGVERTYVVYAGRLLGVIRREQLSASASA